MKTIELIKKVEQLGLETEAFHHDILIYDKEGRKICSISRSHRFQLDMDHYVTELISDVIKEELFRIVCQYSSTPIEERVIEHKDNLLLRLSNHRFKKFF